MTLQVNAVTAQQGASSVKFASNVPKKQQNELMTLLNGAQWQHHDLNGNGQIDKNEVKTAIRNVKSELEEGNNDLFAGEDFYSETPTKDGGLITTTVTPDGVKTECHYDKNDRLLKEVITEDGKIKVYIPKYNPETGMVE